MLKLAKMTPTNRLGKCQVCQKEIGKYKCPRCEVISCSLACSKAHKKLNNFCDGVRNRSKLVQMPKFGFMDLVSDMSLLESATRVASVSNPRPLKRPKSVGRNFRALQKACLRRGYCRLLALPSHFSRHADNGSQFLSESDTILWQVEWILPHSLKHRLVSKTISEKERLGDAVRRICQEAESDSGDGYGYYREARLKDLVVLLKTEVHERDLHGKTRFTELDTDHSLAWNLQGCTLVENPVISIVRKEHSVCFSSC